MSSPCEKKYQITAGDSNQTPPHNMAEEGGKRNGTAYQADEHGGQMAETQKCFLYNWKILLLLSVHD